MSSQAKTINILGVTGSIGQSAADVILSAAEHFDVQVVTAHSNAEKLADMAERLQARQSVLVAKDGQKALEDAAAQPVDITLAAIVGMAGLRPIMKAIQNSKTVAIANKEPLVAAGPLVMAEAKKHGTTLLPVDSEHNAIFQVFDSQRRDSIKKIILTASGGPFRTWSLDEMSKATPGQAIAHPNWSMGPKISVDSATMMNKALEIIEAHYLFEMPAKNIEVLIHPQSIVHSMVEYIDGSVLSQMGASDMRTPIANVLDWPDRLQTPGRTLDLDKMKQLSFEQPDYERFPALKLAYQALESGAYACIAFNAANEVAVEAFLTNRIGFLDIMDCVDHSLERADSQTLTSLGDIEDFDKGVRRMTQDYIQKGATTKMVSAS